MEEIRKLVGLFALPSDHDVAGYETCTWLSSNTSRDGNSPLVFLPSSSSSLSLVFLPFLPSSPPSVAEPFFTFQRVSALLTYVFDHFNVLFTSPDMNKRGFTQLRVRHGFNKRDCE